MTTDSNRIPTYLEALQMLVKKAQEGSVTATVALERALRNQDNPERNELDETIDRLLRE